MVIKGKNFSNKALIEIIIVIILIIIIFSTFTSSYSGLGSSSDKSSPQKKVVQSTSEAGSDYEEALEQRLKNILQHMKGVGDVDVMVTLETGDEVIPAVNENTQDTITNEKDKDSSQRKIDEKNHQRNIVTLQKQGEDEALILKQIKPKVKGVVVVAEGARSSQIQLNICQAVQVALNIEADRVQVFEMDK